MECIVIQQGNASGLPFNVTYGREANFNLSKDHGASNADYGAYASGSDPSMESVRAFIKSIIVPIICVFGMLGNIMIMFVLTRKRLKISCDGTERTVHVGLAALAVSDLLFCVFAFPHGFFKDKYTYYTKSFELLYRIYSGAFINTFILTSTWLTVTMATSRYLAICHPFKARHIIGLKGTKVSIVAVYFLCIVFNIPRLFFYDIEAIPCTNGEKIYFSHDGFMKTNEKAHTLYIWVYFTVGILVPLAILAFCNICLIKALHESVKIRRRYRVPAAHVDSNHRITSILVTIVLMYILFVSPAEILLFAQERLQNLSDAFLMAVEVTNVLQNINFSCNFIMYFILNVQFRRAMRDTLSACCYKCKSGQMEVKSHRAPIHRQVSSRTTHTQV